MALFVLVFLGSTPVGGPIVGWLSDPRNFGPRAGLAVAGATTLAAVLITVAASQRWRLTGAQVGPAPERGVRARGGRVTARPY
jgi:hypothetical protein